MRRKLFRGTMLEAPVIVAVYAIAAAILIPGYLQDGEFWRLAVVTAGGCVVCWILATLKGVDLLWPAIATYLGFSAICLSGVMGQAGVLIFGMAPFSCVPVLNVQAGWADDSPSAE